LYTIFLPNLFGATTNLAINSSQVYITIGLFSLFISRDPKKYHELLWVLIIQEIGNILVQIFHIITGTENFFMTVMIIAINFVYLVALVALRDREIQISE
ncbi:MAG: hypothetical protein ACXAC8_14800, partial [Candidatus Hodarchaeales archaeon]